MSSSQASSSSRRLPRGRPPCRPAAARRRCRWPTAARPARGRSRSALGQRAQVAELDTEERLRRRRGAGTSCVSVRCPWLPARPWPRRSVMVMGGRRLCSCWAIDSAQVAISDQGRKSPSGARTRATSAFSLMPRSEPSIWPAKSRCAARADALHGAGDLGRDSRAAWADHRPDRWRRATRAGA